MRKIIVLLIILMLSKHEPFAQRVYLTLDQAIELSQNSTSYELLQADSLINYYNDRLFKIKTLPKIDLNATLPNLNNSISPITLTDGSEKYVDRFYSSANVGLSVSQLVPFTGGTLSLSSTLDRLDNFNPERSLSYNLNLINFTYSQKITGYNQYKWEKKLHKIQKTIDNIQLIQNREYIKEDVVNLFFSLYIEQCRLELNEFMLEFAKYVYERAVKLYEAHQISEENLLETEIEYHRAQNNNNDMAISMARQGGIGIIHKNMSIEEQASEVDRVKRSESGVIVDPFSLSKGHTIQDADNIMARYKISGVPIVDENNILIGIITNRDIKFETDVTRRIEEAMTTKEHLVTAREGITLEEAKDILGKHRIEKLPIVDEEGHLKGLITIKDIEKKIQYPNSAKDKKGRLLCGAGVGITNDLLERVDALYKAKVDIIVLDSAHGHSQNVINALKKVKAAYPDLPVIAGNVATAAGCEDLIKAGADCVKIGMGPGSICTTRVVAGIGVPQITAIMDCYEVAKKYDIPIIADGGIQYSGDIVKALAAGANVCMMGSMFAGTEESPGEIVLYAGRSYKTYRGMGSIAAMEDGSKDRYFQSGQKKLVPEGVEGMVAYKGKAEDIVFQMIGGIKSGMGYCGAPTIEQLQANAEFVKITAASLKESHPHDIKITKEAPNYSTQGDMM